MVAKSKKATRVPGDSPTEGAAAPAPAPAAALPPAVVAATEGATKMSYADAVRLASQGKLQDRVLTEKGWYIPDPARVVE
jgi:hypothetical protein